jgi:hypothetical protein
MKGGSFSSTIASIEKRGLFALGRSQHNLHDELCTVLLPSSPLMRTAYS